MSVINLVFCSNDLFLFSVWNSFDYMLEFYISPFMSFSFSHAFGKGIQN